MSSLCSLKVLGLYVYIKKLTLTINQQSSNYSLSLAYRFIINNNFSNFNKKKHVCHQLLIKWSMDWLFRLEASLPAHGNRRMMTKQAGFIYVSYTSAIIIIKSKNINATHIICYIKNSYSGY